MRAEPSYIIYPTLLDSFTGWVESDRLWGEFWGNSESPSITAEEFEQKQYQSLLNTINRVPIPWEETEAMDRGTAFNEMVDCIILGKKSEKMWITSDKAAGTITAEYNRRSFTFPIALCREFAAYFEGSMPQVRVDATLQTKYGMVGLYGYVDELMPMAIHDIKTTSRYSIGKYRRNWQHIVYPFCLTRMGLPLGSFEYNIAQLSISKVDGSVLKYETYTELYNYCPETDDPRLIDIVERFIEFAEANRDKITNNKIFNEN